MLNAFAGCHVTEKLVASGILDLFEKRHVTLRLRSLIAISIRHLVTEARAEDTFHKKFSFGLVKA
jgi:hypothetical protein